MTNTTDIYPNLLNIDPNARPLLPDGVYTLQIVKAEKKEGVSQKSGKPYTLFSFRFVVVNHPELSGRTLFESFFPSEMSYNHIKRISDATGVISEDGDLESTLALFTQMQPQLTVPIGSRPDVAKDGTIRTRGADGGPANVQTINWFQVMPA